MNWNGYERRRPGIYVEGLRNTAKNVKIPM
jgi:hypothetical protein